MDKRLRNLLAEVFRLRASEVHPELEKADVDNWDSLTQMDLVVSLEKEFGIVLDIADIVRMNSIASIIEILKEKGVNFGD